MKACNVLGAVRTLEELYKSIPAKDRKEAKKAVGKLYQKVNKDRIKLQKMAAFAKRPDGTVDREKSPDLSELRGNQGSIDIGRFLAKGAEAYRNSEEKTKLFQFFEKLHRALKSSEEIKAARINIGESVTDPVFAESLNDAIVASVLMKQPARNAKNLYEKVKQIGVKINKQRALMREYAEWMMFRVQEGKVSRLVVDYDVDLAQSNVGKLLKNEKGGRSGRFRTDSGVIEIADYQGLLNDEKKIKQLAKESDVGEEVIKNRLKALVESDFVQRVTLHEYIHGGAIEFMQNNPKDPKTMYINNLFKRVKALEQENPTMFEGVSDYWKTNVDEFVAEGLSNPALMDILNKMDRKGATKTKEKKKLTALDRFIEAVSQMIGLRKGSELEALMEKFAGMTTRKRKLGDIAQAGERSAILQEVIKCRAGA